MFGPTSHWTDYLLIITDPVYAAVIRWMNPTHRSALVLRSSGRPPSPRRPRRAAASLCEVPSSQREIRGVSLISAICWRLRRVSTLNCSWFDGLSSFLEKLSCRSVSAPPPPHRSSHRAPDVTSYFIKPWGPHHTQARTRTCSS